MCNMFRYFKKFLFSSSSLYAFIYVIFLIASGVYVYAAASGTGFAIPVLNALGEDGQIISFEKGSYVQSYRSYDEGIYGVISDDPITSVIDTNLQSYKTVVTTGTADVYVTTMNGEIKKGDFITSSEKPGIGMKATETGQVVGVAEEDYTALNTAVPAKILVFIDIHSQIKRQEPRSNNILTALKAGLDSQFLSPLLSVRYLIAALVAGVSFATSFGAFGKVSGNSVEALGRNPLASGHIKSVVFFNFLLTFFIMLAGLLVAYLILVL